MQRHRTILALFAAMLVLAAPTTASAAGWSSDPDRVVHGGGPRR